MKKIKQAALRSKIANSFQAYLLNETKQPIFESFNNNEFINKKFLPF